MQCPWRQKRALDPLQLKLIEVGSGIEPGSSKTVISAPNHSAFSPPEKFLLAHNYNPNTWKTDTGRSLRAAWGIQQDPTKHISLFIYNKDTGISNRKNIFYKKNIKC